MQMMIDSTGKRVLVTGATRGIGRAIAEAFIEAGARVALHGSCNESVDRLANVLGKSNSLVTAPGSIANIDGCRRIVEAALTGLGGFDMLINNAGRWNFATVEVADGMRTRRASARALPMRNQWSATSR